MTSLFDKVPVQGREILLSVKRKFSKLSIFVMTGGEKGDFENILCKF